MGAAAAVIGFLGLLVLVQVAFYLRPGSVAWDDPATRRRLLIAAVVVGAGLRLLWVIWATRQPTEFRDPAEYLRIASDFGHGIMPRFAGVARSDYWPPGWPALLAPFVWIADKTGWISPAFTASLVNVAAGTTTIVLTAVLAGQWFGDRARILAAWFVALWPALIYWTSTAHSETSFTPFFLGILVLTTRYVDRDEDGWRSWALVGALVAFAFLIRSPGVIGLAIPALTVRARRGSWRGAVRVTGVVLATTILLLVPWTIVNGVQLGIWSPGSTNNAAAVCFGHHEDTKPLFDFADLTPELQIDCYRRSPFDDQRLTAQYEAAGSLPAGIELGHPDEAAWYRDAMGKGVHYAVTHPVDEAVLSTEKVWVIWRNEGRAVDGARQYADIGWAGRWHFTLGVIGNVWLTVLTVLALLGMIFVPACRRALPIWVPILLYTLAIVGGSAEPHYRYPVSPLIALLAAAFLCRAPSREPASASQ